MAKDTTSYVWRARKRNFLGLPWTFTVYKLTDEKLLIESGFLSKKEEEIRLYRILDITLNRPLWQRLFGLGTVHCCTADKTSPELDILRIKDCAKFKNMLSDMVEKQRDEKRITAREYIGDDFDDELDH